MERETAAKKRPSNAEGRVLLGTEKDFDIREPLAICPGASQTFDLKAEAVRDKIVFDLRFSDQEDFMFQLRLPDRGESMLARLDIVGQPHRNPGGEWVQTPHLHLYHQRYESGIAHPIDPYEFRDIRDFQKSYADFCSRFHIVRSPRLDVEG